MVKTFEEAGFKHRLSEYFVDQELLIKDGGVWEFIHRSYQAENIADPERSAVSAYVESVLGSDFRDTKNWHLYKKQDLDLEKISDNQIINNRIAEIYKIRAEYYPKIIETILAQSERHNLTDQNITNFENMLVNRTVSYGELYYTYILKHYYQIIESFKATPQVIDLLNVFDDFVEIFCNHKYLIDDMGQLISNHDTPNSPECKVVCQLTKGFIDHPEYYCSKFDPFQEIVIQESVVQEIDYLGNAINE